MERTETVLRIDKMEMPADKRPNTEDPHTRSEEKGRTIPSCRYTIPSPLETYMKNSYSMSRLDGSDLSQNLIERLLELFDQSIVKVDGQLDEEMNVLIEKRYIVLVSDNHIRISDGVDRDAIIEKRVKPFNDRTIKVYQDVNSLPTPSGGCRVRRR